MAYLVGSSGGDFSVQVKLETCWLRKVASRAAHHTDSIEHCCFERCICNWEDAGGGRGARIEAWLQGAEQAVGGSQTAGGRPPRGPGRSHNFYPSHPSSLPRNIGRSSVGASPPPSAAGIGWLLGSSPVEGGALGTSPAAKVGSLPLPHFQHPSYELLERNGFQQMKYERWKQRCLDERSHTGAQLVLPWC